MTEKQTKDWSIILLGMAAAIFLSVVIILIGGFAWAWAWNTFAVVAFGLTAIETIDGVAAMVLLFLSGWALGLRKNKGK